MNARAGRAGLQRVIAASLLPVMLGGCAPRLTVLAGSPYDGPLPNTSLVGHRRMVFDWEYLDQVRRLNGEGIIRTAGPDSARVDIYIGVADGRHAILIGDAAPRSPYNDVTDLLPPAPLLWAAVGRFAVPPAADTAMRIQEGSVVVEISGETRWRATFDGSRLVRLERASGNRVIETVTRALDGSVTYVDERRKRRLRIRNVETFNDPPYDSSIWRD